MSLEKPGLAALIASKAKEAKSDDSGKSEAAIAAIADEIMGAFKDGNSKVAGKALLNMVRYALNTKE